MKRLYLDYNVISYLKSNLQPELTAAVNRAVRDQLIVFSPAHLEDIAVSEKRAKGGASFVKDEIEFLAEIACKNALRPIDGYQVVLYHESPQDCYERVVKMYEENDLAEQISDDVIADSHDWPAGNPKTMNNIDPADVLRHITHREIIVWALAAAKKIEGDEMMKAVFWKFDDLKNRFRVFEAYVELAANRLEKIGYYREARDKSRARLHDVSHIIYAAYCDTFVTADKRLAKKAQAIYSLLNVSTQVLLPQEFVSQTR